MGVCGNPTKFAGVMIVIAILAATGCSYSTLTAPENQARDNSRVTESGRVLWGIWDIIINNDGDVQVIDTRTAGTHANVIGYILPPNCSDCLIIVINEIVPAEHRLEADVTLKNPTMLNGFDVRGILISNVGHDLYNADSYTNLWDDGGAVTRNPFKCFPVLPTEQIFQSGYSYTNHYSVKLPAPLQLTAIKMAVDASWPAYCKEPFTLGFAGKDVFGKLCEDNGELNVYVDVLTHFPPVESVILDMSPLGGGDVALTPWVSIPGLVNFYSAFAVPLPGVTQGQYELWLRAKSSGVSTLIYDKVQVNISPGAEFTPKPTLIKVVDYPFEQSGVAVKDGNLYALGADGLRVYSLGSDGEPTLIGQAGAPQQVTDRYFLYLDSNKAFAFFEKWEQYTSKLAIYDITTPSAPVLRGVRESLPIIGGGSAKGDYFLCSVPVQKKIVCINATNPDDPFIGGSYTLLETPSTIARDGDNLFVALENKGVGIFGVTNPLSPTPKGTYYLSKIAVSPIAVANQTGYIWTTEGKLVIFSYTNPSFPKPLSTTVIKAGWTGDQFTGFYPDGKWLYAWGSALYVINVADTLKPQLSFEPSIPQLTPDTTQGVAFNGAFSYAPKSLKLQVIKSY